MRLLLDPAATDTQGGGATPPPGTAPAPPAPPPPPTATKLEISAEEFTALYAARTKLQEIEAANRQALEQAHQKELLALAEKGKAEEALNTLRAAKDAEIQAANAKAGALETSILGSAKAAAISAALLGAKFVNDVAGGQVLQLLDGRFEATRDAAGVVQVRERGTGKPAGETIKTWLASSDAAHFLQPTSQGGAGTTGTQQTTPTPGTPPSDAELAKLPYDQQVLAALKARQVNHPGNPYAFGARPASKN